MTTPADPTTSQRAGAWLTTAILFAATIPPAKIVAQDNLIQPATAAAAQPGSEAFPDGITPNDVFARLDLVDRQLDQLITASNISLTNLPPKMESQLGPLHVYQMVLSCSQRVQQLDDQVGVLAVPTLSAKPRAYTPRDVLYISGLLLDGVRRAAATFNIEDLPTDEIAVTGKTPTEVFERATSVFLKLSALCGHDDIAPGEVYAEMVRAAEDVRSILRQADPESRYRIDAPPSATGLVPGDVFEKCLDIRTLLNKHRVALGEPEIPLPSPPANYEIRPRDVFLQTQIIIAELNSLKLHTNTISTTPLPVPVSSKVPTQVHAQASLLEYLLGQVKTAGKTSAVKQASD